MFKTCGVLCLVAIIGLGVFALAAKDPTQVVRGDVLVERYYQGLANADEAAALEQVCIDQRDAMQLTVRAGIRAMREYGGPVSYELKEVVKDIYYFVPYSRPPVETRYATLTLPDSTTRAEEIKERCILLGCCIESVRVAP